jgi:hypothetical protein
LARIEDDDTMRHEQHAGDLHQLPLRDREPRDDGIRIDIGAEITDRLRGALVHLSVVDREAFAEFPAEIDILRHREIWGQQDFLMHQHDAVLFGIHRPGKAHRLAVDRKLAARWLVVARQNLHQRRLAGAVLADDGMHLTGIHRQADVL